MATRFSTFSRGLFFHVRIVCVDIYICFRARVRMCTRIFELACAVSVCACVCIPQTGHAQAVPACLLPSPPTDPFFSFYLPSSASAAAAPLGFFSVIFFILTIPPTRGSADCGVHNIYLLRSEFFNRGKLSVGLVTLPVFDPSAKKKK